jgi:hypothetical protein
VNNKKKKKKEEVNNKKKEKKKGIITAIFQFYNLLFITHPILILHIRLITNHPV